MELINKYRPKLFKHVIGQDEICRSIRKAIKDGTGRSFLLAGPTGVGKTTLGRLIAKDVGCPPNEVMEIDGASNTGIDDMRGITSHFGYKSLTGHPRVIIVDECHAISAQAWKSLLKSIEEPPEDVYWVLCTTELGKVPAEIKKGRCLVYSLKPISFEEIRESVFWVGKNEGMAIIDSPKGLNVIADLAQGSMRAGLSMLAKAGHLTDEDDIMEICSEEGGGANKEAIDLCRLLMGNTNWKQVATCISNISSPPESVRIVVLRYMSAVALKKPKPQKELAIMEEFSEPFQDREGKAPILLACARLMLG